MITLYNEKNEKIKLISTFEFNDADMGESSISATVSFDKEQDFHPDWYVVYNGEKFRLGVRKPTGKKDTSSLQTSYTLVFKSEREDLKRYTFMDFVELGGGNPQPSSYNVSLYATLSEFVDRFNTNLRYYMGSRWEMVLPDGYMEDGNAVFVAFENASLWDVLLRVYEAFGVRWVIRSAGNVLQIQVGFQEVEIEHIFEYGKGNGLVSVERNNALERIITRLRGRGSEKNLPPDYFHTGDPDTNSFLQATFFKNLMPKSYRDYIRGYNAGSGTGSWAYNQGVADRVSGRNISPVDYAISDKEDLWGVSYGAIEPNEQIFPTLQGATRNGVRLDEVLSVEQVLADGVREPQNTITVGIGTGGQESSSGKCGDGRKNNYFEDCRDGVEFTVLTDRFQVTNPINTAQIRITMSPSYIGDDGLPVPVEFGATSTVRSSAELQLVDVAGSTNGKVIRTQTISDTDSYLWELDDIPAGDYRFRANVVWSADIQREGYDPTAGDVVVNVDTRLTGATVKEYARATDKGEFKETFDIEIRDVWGVTRNSGESDEDYTYRVWEPRAVSEDMAVMFSDGLLAGEDYEFRIVGFNSDANNLRQTIISAIKPTAEGGWKLTLQKSDAELEASNIYLPNTMQNAKAGDHFFFVNISMPYDPYVYDAEERVLSYLDEQLALKDEEYPSFTITPSKIFCSSFTEADKIQAGAKIRVRNTALVGESYISLYIQSLTKRYSVNSLNPEWNLTISDLVVASGNPVETLQGEVDVLSQRVYSNRNAVQEAVRSLSSTFLRKDGIADTSYSPTEFKKPVKLGEGISDRDFINGDISGKGFGVYTDGDGNRVIEADILVGRVGARFNEVVINQATYSAGKQVFSSAGMVVSRVEDVGTSWRCYFDTKNATVRNYFVVNDGAFCQRFVDSGIRQYWARVASVGPDYIDISKTDRMEGSFNPIVGDNIAQLGNSTDRSRQAALIIDETREGGGLVTWYDDITNFTLYDNNSVNIGRIAEAIEVEGVSNTVYKTWLQVYGSAFIGNRDKSQFMEFDNKTLKLRGRLEVGSTISNAMTVVEDGLIQSTLLKLGYYKDDIFKIMSGTNGLYDENVLGGGIAAWYGGPMADKEADSSLIEYAQSLFRFDGSGYLAGGNITWDKDGAGSVAGGDIKWDKDGAITLGVGIKISGDANETLGSILNLVNKIASWFGEDEDTGAIYVKKKGSEARDFYTYGAISFGGAGEGNGGASGGGITTFDIVVNGQTYNLQDGKVVLPDYPTSLKNPYALTINGVTYDGSKAVEVNISGSGGGVADSIDWSKILNKPTTLEGYGLSNEVNGLLEDYLPLSGGTMTGAIITPGDDSIVIQPAKDACDQIGAEDCKFWKIHALLFKGDLEGNANTATNIKWSGVTDTPTTIGGYGITDAITTSNIGSQSVNYATSAGSATKLTNTRTIWGQDFNGSGNVSGSMTDVMNVTPASAHNFNNGSASNPWSTIYTRYLDTYTGYDLRFKVGGSEQMRLTAAKGCLILGDSSVAEPEKCKLWLNGNMIISSTTDTSAKSNKLRFLRNTVKDEYWDFGLYSQTTKGLTFFMSINGTDTDIAYLTGEGNFVVNGSITFGSASDRRLKDNIKSMTDKQAVAVLSALNPVTFSWNSTAYELGKLSGVSDGFIADEYERLIPNSGRDIWANYRAINYERATGYLVKGWQNHETRLEKAERRIKELENELKQYRYGTV